MNFLQRICVFGTRMFWWFFKFFVPQKNAITKEFATFFLDAFIIGRQWSEFVTCGCVLWYQADRSACVADDRWMRRIFPGFGDDFKQNSQLTLEAWYISFVIRVPASVCNWFFFVIGRCNFCWCFPFINFKVLQSFDVFKQLLIVAHRGLTKVNSNWYYKMPIGSSDCPPKRLLRAKRWCVFLKFLQLRREYTCHILVVLPDCWARWHFSIYVFVCFPYQIVSCLLRFFWLYVAVISLF